MVVAGLVACDTLGGFETGSVGPDDPPIVPVATPTRAPQLRPTTPAPSAASEELRIHFARVQNDLLVQGLLRQDGGGIDTPYNDRMLTENFVRIALFDEYISDINGLRAQTTASSLRRWAEPVRISVEFGDSVPLHQRSQDAANVTHYAARLGRVTGHPITVSDEAPNFNILVLNEDDRAGFEPRLRELIPEIKPETIRTFMSLDRSTFCIVVAFAKQDEHTYSHAIALIRGEHPDLMRLACIHEEMAQGLGLANDSPRARPSIFNDDEEFGLLTTHDEQLLKILYDPRLTPGMTEPEATPIVRQIASELLGGPA